MDALVKEEASKVDNGTSELTKANPEASGGMGLGGTIMASMAGAMLGSYIGNKLLEIKTTKITVKLATNLLQPTQ